MRLHIHMQEAHLRLGRGQVRVPEVTRPRYWRTELNTAPDTGPGRRPAEDAPRRLWQQRDRRARQGLPHSPRPRGPQSLLRLPIIQLLPLDLGRLCLLRDRHPRHVRLRYRHGRSPDAKGEFCKSL